MAQTLQQDVKLELGQVTDSVTVEATAGQIQEREASLSQVIDERRVRELPINGRNFMQLAFLSSGIVTAGRGSATQRQASYGPAFSAGGQRDNTTTVLVDGIEISGMELNNYPYAIPSLDSVGEFRVVTSGASAEFGGNSGAFVNVVTRRGTNQLHGSLFEFLRNDTLDARNFFDVTGKSAPNKRNQFGFVVTGPVFIPKLYNGKDKTFFMFSWEWQRQRNGATSTALVPTPAERAGDFSASSTPVVDPLSKVPFPNNRIPPKPYRPGRFGPGELVSDAEQCGPIEEIRQCPAAQVRLHGAVIPRRPYTDLEEHFVLADHPQQAGRHRARTGAHPGVQIRCRAIRFAHAIGSWRYPPVHPSIINEASIGFVRMNRIRNSADSFQRNWIEELGIRGVPTQPLTYGAPAVTISGYPQAGFSTNNAFFQWITQSVQYVDNLSITSGRHTMKLGGTYQRKQLNSTQWGAPNGNYAFTGVYTSPPPVGTPTRESAIADTLLGFPATYSVQPTPYEQRLRYSNAALYFQED